MNIGNLFLESAIKRFREMKSLGDKTFAQLNEHQMTEEPREGVNSIAIIVQHLNGNMRSRWTNFLTEDGEKEWRDRDSEFETGAQTKEDILRLWEEGWKVVLDAMESLANEDLSKTITIRQQPLNVVDAINRQLTHYSAHVGQIMLLGKYFTGEAWQSLSIPKGTSRQYNQEQMHRNKS